MIPKKIMNLSTLLSEAPTPKDILFVSRRLDPAFFSDEIGINTVDRLGLNLIPDSIAGLIYATLEFNAFYKDTGIPASQGNAKLKIPLTMHAASFYNGNQFNSNMLLKKILDSLSSSNPDVPVLHSFDDNRNHNPVLRYDFTETRYPNMNPTSGTYRIYANNAWYHFPQLSETNVVSVYVDLSNGIEGITLVSYAPPIRSEHRKRDALAVNTRYESVSALVRNLSNATRAVMQGIKDAEAETGYTPDFDVAKLDKMAPPQGMYWAGGTIGMMPLQKTELVF